MPSFSILTMSSEGRLQRSSSEGRKRISTRLLFHCRFDRMPGMFMHCWYHGLMLLIDVLLLYCIWRSRFVPPIAFFVLCCCGGFAAVCYAFVFGGLDANLAIHGLAWHGSFFLFASAFLMYRQRRNDKPRRGFPSLVLAFGCIYFGLAANTLLFEPTALVVRELTITTPKMTQPMTIVFASDFQTDDPGRYERWTLQKIKEQHADLIVFGGDYTQGSRDHDYRKAITDWNQLLREIDLQAPLGIYAVRGTPVHDRQGWKEQFHDTAIIPLEQTQTESIGEIRVTFLSSWASGTQRTFPDAEREDKFRIIVGHHPLYAMAPQEAELLLAGHTHGGQVQIPFVGLPIVTYSGPLPKRWATGITPMPNGATLIVSHGTGLSSGRAPQVRFHCRPDFWVIRLVPQ